LAEGNLQNLVTAGSALTAMSAGIPYAPSENKKKT